MSKALQQVTRKGSAKRATERREANYCTWSLEEVRDQVRRAKGVRK